MNTLWKTSEWQPLHNWDLKWLLHRVKEEGTFQHTYLDSQLCVRNNVNHAIYYQQHRKQGSPFMRETESLLKRSPVLAWKCCYIFLHLSSPNLIENDHNFVFFGYKVSTQHVCFEKLPRSWEFMHKWRCLVVTKNCHYFDISNVIVLYYFISILDV